LWWVPASRTNRSGFGGNSSSMPKSSTISCGPAVLRES
jgi:hypothetical protein